MADLEKLRANLEARGFRTAYFPTADEAAAYLDGQIDGKTSALSPKTTRTTQGVNVMSLKPKYRVEKALPLAQTPIRNAARYRARSLPIAGMLLRPEDRAEEQMTLLE